MANTPLIPSKSPNLLIAPVEYTQAYQDQLNNALRLYFNQVDNFTQNATIPSYGPTIDRPTVNLMVGQVYFDTTLGYPVWWNGSGWVAGSSPSSSVPTGCILMWSGSIGTIPAGWQLCDGTGGTPNLQDKFIVGAGSTYAVAATGGFANSIVVSHSHTITDSGHAHVISDSGHVHSVTDSGHAHAITDPGHAHNYVTVGVGADIMSPGGLGLTPFTTTTSSTGISVNTGFASVTANSNTTGVTVNSNVTSITVNSQGSSGTNANLPPYYALAYIMKM
jgi:hypothetical protein